MRKDKMLTATLANAITKAAKELNLGLSAPAATTIAKAIIKEIAKGPERRNK